MFSICWRLESANGVGGERVSSESNEQGNELKKEGRCELNENEAHDITQRRRK